jgi:serine/threonine protein phosphatase PrpC
MGPRPLQQDAVHVGAVRGSIPFIVLCDGHGYVNLLNNAPSETPVELRNLLHVGGRQAAEISCQAIAQYLDKYGHEFDVHTADRFFHKAFCLAHEVVLKQIRLGALTEDLEGGLARYVHAIGNGPGSALDAAYFKQSVSRWANQVPKATGSAAVISKHVRTLDIPPASTPPPSPPADAPGIREGTVGEGKGGVEGVYYKRANGTWDHLDLGTTATCCMVLNAPDATKPHRKLCVTAHVGDSDACLFRFAAPNPSGRPVLQMVAPASPPYPFLCDCLPRSGKVTRVCVCVCVCLFVGTGNMVDQGAHAVRRGGALSGRAKRRSASSL